MSFAAGAEPMRAPLPSKEESGAGKHPFMQSRESSLCGPEPPSAETRKHPAAAGRPRRLRSENHCKPCLGTPQTPPRETTVESGVRQSAGYDPRIVANLLAEQKFAEPAPQTTAAAHTNIDRMRAEVCDNGIARDTIDSAHRLRKAQPRKTGTALKETERRANALFRKETETISPLRTRRPRAGCRWRRPADRRHWPAGLRPAHRPHPGPAAGRRCPAKRPAKRR